MDEMLYGSCCLPPVAPLTRNILTSSKPGVLLMMSLVAARSSMLRNREKSRLEMEGAPIPTGWRVESRVNVVHLCKQKRILKGLSH